MSTDLRAVGFEEVRSRLTGNRLAVYEHLLKRGTATAIELAEVMGWDKTSVRPRLCELVAMHHARPTGVRRNHEHEFEAVSVKEAEALHLAEQRSTGGTMPVENPNQLHLVI